jgi:hypothetical protein
MMKILNPSPEEIRDRFVATNVDEKSVYHIADSTAVVSPDNRSLGILSNNKWNVRPFLQEIIKLLEADVQDLRVEYQKKLNAAQTVNQDLVSRIAERTHFAITGIGD